MKKDMLKQISIFLSFCWCPLTFNIYFSVRKDRFSKETHLNRCRISGGGSVLFGSWCVGAPFLTVSRCLAPVCQVWWTARCWSRWSEGTGCHARRAAQSPSTNWWICVGRRTLMRDQHLNISSPSWKTISLLQSHSTSQEKIYNPRSLFYMHQSAKIVKNLCRLPHLRTGIKRRKASSPCMFLMVNWNSRHGCTKPLFFFPSVKL